MISPPVIDAIPGLPPAKAFNPVLISRLQTKRILAVVTIDEIETALPVIRALAEGGVGAIELAWRTPKTLEALRAIRAEAPEMLVGVGTLLTPEQVAAAHAAGAHFGVSPGLSVPVIQAAKWVGLDYAPGVQTPSDLHTAVEQGCRFLKYFPAESVGGLKHLKSMAAPFAHLNLQFIALGGIDEAKADDYLADPLITVLGGSWIAPSAMIKQRNWNGIRLLAIRSQLRLTGAAKGD